MKRRYGDRPIPEPLLTTGEVARYCHTSISQVKRWIENKDLKTIQTTGGHYRIRKEDFRAFLEKMDLPVIEEFFAGVTKKKILIADDDASVVKAFSILIKNHYKDIVEIETASDGYEALIKAGSFNPDLMILDIRMPKIDGLSVCQRLKADSSTNPNMKIIAITAHSEAYDRDTVLAAGADEYLLKPIDMYILIEHVDTFIT